MIDRLQYITQGTTPEDHIQLCRAVCDAGVKWVQLRLKQVDVDTYLETAKVCREITSSHGAQLIINDNLDIAQQINADGVHLGLSDLNTAAARERSSSDFIIGGTANTYEDVLNHHQNGVDYVGVGPFRHTTTKDKLSPILGLEGYQKINDTLRTANVNIPVIAIGGVLESDLIDLRSTGIHGIAVSGLITKAENKLELVNELYKNLAYASA